MKPILFNTDMVRTILDGRKTATRRIVKAPVLYSGTEPPSRIFRDGDLFQFQWNTGKTIGGFAIKPPYLSGNILYVRETWAEWSGGYVYKADEICSAYPLAFVDRWHPSIHMPKEAARLFLRVTDMRVERLQEITDEGAKAEGANNGIGVADKMRESAIQRFQKIWDSTIKPTVLSAYGWEANPYVWVIEFERCEKPEA